MDAQQNQSISNKKPEQSLDKTPMKPINRNKVTTVTSTTMTNKQQY